LWNKEARSVSTTHPNTLHKAKVEMKERERRIGRMTNKQQWRKLM
jgi:hypothetical protein